MGPLLARACCWRGPWPARAGHGQDRRAGVQGLRQRASGGYRSSSAAGASWPGRGGRQAWAILARVVLLGQHDIELGLQADPDRVRGPKGPGHHGCGDRALRLSGLFPAPDTTLVPEDGAKAWDVCSPQIRWRSADSNTPADARALGVPRRTEALT